MQNPTDPRFDPGPGDRSIGSISGKVFKPLFTLESMYLERYLPAKEILLKDNTINEDNRKLFKKFLDYQEYKLKRTNHNSIIDESSSKTCYTYILNLRAVNKFFKNKAWKKLTKKDIQEVYDGLEDGTIKNIKGLPYKDKESFYTKIMKSKPFEFAGKKVLAQEVIQYYSRVPEDVRFIEFDTFKKVVSSANKMEHRLLLWLAFDIGENIFSLLKLQKKNFARKINEDTKEPEYIVNLPREKIKRSRTARSEITNFRETTDLLDLKLNTLKDDEFLFDFGHRYANKFLSVIVKNQNIKVIPKGQPLSWKDFRSSMACHLLKIGWSTDEAKARLGHKPSSKVIDRYASYLAISRHKGKQKVEEGNIKVLRSELDETKEREKLLSMRLEDQNIDLQRANKNMKLILEDMQKEIQQLRDLAIKNGSIPQTKKNQKYIVKILP